MLRIRLTDLTALFLLAALLATLVELPALVVTGGL